MAENEQLTVSIGAAGARGLEIRRHELTNDSGFVAPSFASLGAPHVFLRLYPPVWATLRASVGSVSQQGVRAAQITGEAVVFRGTDQASTEHLVSSGLQVSTVGTAFDLEGNALNVSITADAAGQLKASEPFYGAAIVSYVTQYRLLKYSYDVAAIPGGGSRITGGTVLAFHDGEVATFDLPPPELPEAEPNTAEVYRDVSYAILQNDTAYERPPNWPDETWPQSDLDPDDRWIEVERVHAKGRMEGFCRLAIDGEYITPEQPKQNSPNYVIPIERIIASDESLIDRGFEAGCIARAKTQIPATLGALG